MTGPRIVNGALTVPGELCGPLAAALGMVLDAQRLHGASPNRRLVELRLLAAEAKRLAEQGAFQSESFSSPSAEFAVQCVPASVAASALGITRQAVTSRCRSGAMPGARQLANGQWLIPTDLLPHEDIADADHRSTAHAS